MQASFITEAVVAAAGDLGYSSLKEEQLKVVTTFLEGRDIFAVLSGGSRNLERGVQPCAHKASLVPRSEKGRKKGIATPTSGN